MIQYCSAGFSKYLMPFSRGVIQSPLADHLARNFRVSAFVRVHQTAIVEIGKPDRGENEQQDDDAAAGQRRQRRQRAAGEAARGHRGRARFYRVPQYGGDSRLACCSTRHSLPCEHVDTAWTHSARTCRSAAICRRVVRGRSIIDLM